MLRMSLLCLLDFLTAHGLIVDLQPGCTTSNEDPHLVLPCTLHVLSTSG